jgi:type III secretion protein L
MGVVVLIDRPGYRLAADRKVLKSSEALVVENTAQAYVMAHGQISAALRNVEQVCTQARNDAYKDGLAKAESEAVRRWTLAEIDRLSWLKALQPALAEVVVDAVSLLAKEIDRENLLARALELLQTSLRAVSRASLRVHPASVEAAESALRRFDRQTGLGRVADVVPDETLAEDACILESESGKVDASLQTQLDAIREAIESAAQRAVTRST